MMHPNKNFIWKNFNFFSRAQMLPTNASPKHNTSVPVFSMICLELFGDHSFMQMQDY